MNGKAFPCIVPREAFIFGWGLHSDEMSPQLTAGDTVEIVCVVFFPYAQVRSHIGVVLASDTFLAPCKAHGGSLDKLLPGEYGRGQVCRRTLGQGAACQHDPHQSVAGGDLQAPGKTRIKAEGKGLQ